MQIKNKTVESFLKGFAFSLLLSLYCGVFAFLRFRSLLNEFEYFELLHLILNLTFVVLFLVRTRPAEVTMNPVHWLVALLTSCSGFYFFRESPPDHLLFARIAYVLMIIAAVLCYAAALTLGRSFGLLPARRRVKTRYIFQFVRHPMYLSSILNKIAYLLKNPSLVNLLLTLTVTILYAKRAGYEEDLLSTDPAYQKYRSQVKYRFLPRLY